MSLKVLSVDDSKTIRMIVKKAFRSYDCDIFEAENGVEGLSIANKEKPDIIVLDITMPVMDGVEMLEKMKGEESLKDIPVIMLTAESGKENVMNIVKLGVNDYIVKPFKGEQLIERVKKIVKLENVKEGGTDGDRIKKYFTTDEDFQILTIPDKVSGPVVAGVEDSLKGKMKEMSGSGMNKIILDLSKVSEVNISLVKLIVSVLKSCKNAEIKARVLGTEALQGELKGFHETGDLPISHTLEEAKGSF